MKKTLLVLSLLISTSAFAKTINCVLTTENYVKVTGAEVAINDLKTDGNARIVETQLYNETWIVSAVNVGNKGDVIVTASKLMSTDLNNDNILVNGKQASLSVSIKTDGSLSAGKTVMSTLADTTHHLFCEAN